MAPAGVCAGGKGVSQLSTPFPRPQESRSAVTDRPGKHGGGGQRPSWGTCAQALERKELVKRPATVLVLGTGMSISHIDKEAALLAEAKVCWVGLFTGLEIRVSWSYLFKKP